MRSIISSFVGLAVAGILALAPTAAFAHGGGGGGHGGGGSHGGGSGHFGGVAGHSFASHSFTQYQGGHFARRGDYFRHGGHFFFGGPFGYDYPNYGYYDDNTGDYSDQESLPSEVTPSQGIIIAVQKQLAQLGYYHGPVDGLIGPQTESAIRWFQSVDRIPVTGQIDDPTLEALRIS